MRQHLSFLFVVLVAGCRPNGAEQKGGRPAASVEVETLRPEKVREYTEYIAALKSRRSIVLQPQVEGQLTKIFVKSGAVVEAGTPLMQIDPARQAASVVSAQASRASQRATLNYSKQAYERAQRLYEGGAVSKQELDQSKATYESSQAEAEALGAQIRSSQVQLDYYRILAPSHGVVGDIPVRVGDHVTPATQLTTIDENGLLEAYISVPVERSAQLRPGLEIELVDSTGQSISDGKVSFISPQVNEDTQSILVKTFVPNDSGVLRADQYVRARVVWSTRDGILVPALAVTRINGQTFVYLAQQEGGKLVARQKPVALGELQSGSYVAKSGLAAGDRLVVSGTQRIGDGALIIEKAKK
ncbi:MAG: efflux RND transporter periplasmic adaptor subunit [Polyangia bacterium]